MRDELYSALGVYNSAFIRMNVHSHGNLSDITKIPTDSEATFFHEYIHFLQDVSTTSGLMNISNVVDFIKYVNVEARGDGQADFKVPITPNSSALHNVKANWEFKTIYAGSGNINHTIAKINSLTINVIPVQTTSGITNVKQLNLNYSDQFNINHDYVIGSYCITECMAYLMEQHLYANVLPQVNQLPYLSVKLICDYLHPGFSTNPLNVIALCDACLMLYNPGHFLYEVLVKMSSKSYFPSKPDNVYDEVYSKVSFNYLGNTTIDQLLQFNSCLARNQMCDYFTTDQFKDNSAWVTTVFHNAFTIRLSKPNFMLELLRGGTLVSNGIISNQVYKNVYDLLGTPIIINDLNELFFHAPKGTSFDLRLKYLWLINQTYKIYSRGLTQGIYKCEMKDWCDKRAAEKGIPQFTNYSCVTTPWVRSKDPQPNPCAFSRLWYMWGMMDEAPVEQLILKKNYFNTFLSWISRKIFRNT